MTGQDLHQLLLDKWGRSYDIQLRRFKDKVLVQIMWKYLEQLSFPLSQDDYFDHLETVANYINGFGGIDQVRNYIINTKECPRIGKAICIPIELGERASEWMI